jgi:hypothetical protein
MQPQISNFLPPFWYFDIFIMSGKDAFPEARKYLILFLYLKMALQKGDSSP